MGTTNIEKSRRLLDPANDALQGQAKVNAEIFIAVEILGRKLERVAAERDRLAQRLALIESQATIDEKTGKLYLPVVIGGDTPPAPQTAALPRWLAPAAAASLVMALFAVGTVLLRPAAPALTKNQIAILNALSASQFTQIEPDSKKWKTLAEAQSPAQPLATAVAQEKTQPVQSTQSAMPFSQSVPAQTSSPERTAATTGTATEKTASAPPKASLTAAEEDIQVPPSGAADVQAAPAITAAATPVITQNPLPEKRPTKKTAAATPEKATQTAAAAPAPPVKPAAKNTAPENAVAKNVVPVTAAAGGIAPDETLTGDLADLQKRAYAGTPAAQHDLATLYAAGNDVPQNYARARFWFTRAADQNVANASYNLGVIYHQGLGVKTDLKTALYWYKKAASLGHPEAMYNLGISYIEGVGTSVDIPKGVGYFERAAGAGVAQAAYNLGVLYESNFIGPINIPAAIKWYRIAAKQGHPGAAAALKRLEGDAVKTKKQAADAAQTADRAARLAPAAGGDVRPHNLLTDIQHILIRQGILSGAASGVLNQDTEDAIRSAQKILGMDQDGQPSHKLLDKLLQMPPTMGKTFP